MARGKGYSETKAFAYFSKVSNEKPLQTREILDVAQALPSRELYLDIGAGVGDISFDVARAFKKSIFIEPGKRTFKILGENAKAQKGLDTNIIEANWDDFYSANKDKCRGKIDLITQVHVVYFLSPLKEKLEQMREMLSPEGKLVVICAKGEEQEKDFVHWFRHKISGDPLNLVPPFANLDRMFPGKTTYKDVTYTFKIRDLDKMEEDHLSSENEATNYFFQFTLKKWFDEFTPEHKAELRKYLNPHKNGDFYLVPSKQRVYVISK